MSDKTKAENPAFSFLVQILNWLKGALD